MPDNSKADAPISSTDLNSHKIDLPYLKLVENLTHEQHLRRNIDHGHFLATVEGTIVDQSQRGRQGQVNETR